MHNNIRRGSRCDHLHVILNLCRSSDRNIFHVDIILISKFRLYPFCIVVICYIPSLKRTVIHRNLNRHRLVKAARVIGIASARALSIAAVLIVCGIRRIPGCILCVIGTASREHSYCHCACKQQRQLL